MYRICIIALALQYGLTVGHGYGGHLEAGQSKPVDGSIIQARFKLHKDDDDDDDDDHHIQVSEPYLGDPVAKTADITCNSDKSCSLGMTVTHMEAVTMTTGAHVDLTADAVFTEVVYGLSKSFSRAVTKASATQYSVTLGPHSKGRLMFRPARVKISGNSRLVAEASCSTGIFSRILTFIGVYKSKKCVKDGSFTLIAPASTQAANGNDVLDGEWYTDYCPNSWPIDSVHFHNIRGKDMPHVADAKLVDRTVANPIHCSQYARDYGFKVAIYRDRQCYMKQAIPRGRMYNSNFGFVGHYFINQSENTKHTHDKVEVEQWSHDNECDMIQYDGYYYYCHKYEGPLTGVVIMFLKEADETKPVKMAHSFMPVDSEHFHNLRDRDIHGQADAKMVADRVASPAHCGRYARDLGFKVATYKNARCYMKTTTGQGRTYASELEFVGNYRLNVTDSIKYSGEKQWVDQWRNAKDCDMLEYDGTYFYCKRYKYVPGAVMMFLKEIEDSKPIDVMSSSRDRPGPRYHLISSVPINAVPVAAPIKSQPDGSNKTESRFARAPRKSTTHKPSDRDDDERS